jgi:cyclophilin family peptidyl-prolyl cis-trans isomerase
MRLSKVRRSVQKTVHGAAMDALESRLLFDAFVGENVGTAFSPVLANTSDPSANSITLNAHFTDPNIPGTLATFYTSYGVIKVALTDAATPLTVANFLSYVNSGAYDNTIFHRSAVLNSSTGLTSLGTAADIIQGGGYVVKGTSFTHIPTSAPVNDEFSTEIYNDSAGTLAMAKTSAANSATSEWYFNVHDNTSSLDSPSISYTV